jgi:hypothetical protein
MLTPDEAIAWLFLFIPFFSVCFVFWVFGLAFKTLKLLKNNLTNKK